MYGDLILTPDQEKEMVNGGKGTAQGFRYSATPWPNGVVPYVLDYRLSKYLATDCVHIILTWGTGLGT